MKPTSESSLPDYLQLISHIYVDEAVADTPMAARVRKAMPEAALTVLEQGEKPGETAGDILYLKDYKGRFLKDCPGTSRYRCCGYKIIHIGENCPLSCTYCILQAYFQDRVLKVWANQEDLFTELETAFSRDPEQKFRVGTGEFTDSLVLEPLTGYTGDLVEFLEAYDNVVLELKSKVVDLSWMNRVKRNDRILPAWSLNAPQIRETEERMTSTLEQRLAGARECAAQGFRVCFHFDPIIHFPGWEKGYKQIVDMIFDYVRPEDIGYVSLGSFRSMPELFRVIRNRHPQSTYIFNEFITGLDNKLRLLRPLRTAQFSHLVSCFRNHGLDRQLYLCMESDQVWKETLGRAPRDLGGLAGFLMNRSFCN